jgi:L-lactate dehydrogenase complex protein LldG
MPPSENPGRERILARIASALKRPAPPPATEAAEEIFPSIDDPLARFEKECAGNGTELLLVLDELSAAAALQRILESIPAGEIFAEDSPDLRRLLEKSGRSVRWSKDGPSKNDTQANVTRADLLVAQTGSILLSAAHGGRGAAVIAPVHIVLARASQLVADLSSAFEFVRKNQALMESSYLTLVTGSSRTGDIEKILVMGAHGPRRLCVILIRD